jgi:hypothetical protein
LKPGRDSYDHLPEWQLAGSMDYRQ